MALTVADINSAVQALMNDASGTVYTAAVILPFVKIANEDLQGHLLDKQVRYLYEEAAEQTIALGGTALTTVPADMVEPIDIYERSTSSTLITDYVKVQRKSPLPDEQQTETLRYWDWREQAVVFLGATAARDIRLRYKKLITALTGSASDIAMMHSKNYFTYRTAGHLRMYVEENEGAAQALYGEAERALELLLGLNVKFNQGQPIRRRPFSHQFRRLR